jgi:hypothetical protein
MATVMSVEDGQGVVCVERSVEGEDEEVEGASELSEIVKCRA